MNNIDLRLYQWDFRAAGVDMWFDNDTVTLTARQGDSAALTLKRRAPDFAQRLDARTRTIARLV
jgi:hypothetical protein